MLPLLPLSLGLALAADTPVPDSLGPLVLRGDGVSMRLRLGAQALGQVDLLPAADRDPVNHPLSLRFRRLRIGLAGRALDDRLSTGLQLNLVPGATELMDAWAQYKPQAGVEIRFGQFKVPWSRYREQSFSALVLSDWPSATRFFGAERQLGLSVGDGPAGQDALGWTLGVFSGVNARRTFAMGLADSFGTAVPNRSDLAGGNATWAVHPELIGRLTAGTPGMDTRTDFDVRGGAARILASLSGAWDLRPEPTEDFSGRAAAELLLKAHHLSAGLVSYAGFFDAGAQDLAPAAWGGVGTLAWRPDPKWGLAAVYSRVEILPGLRDAARDQVLQQVLAADPDDSAALAADLDGVGRLIRSSELGGGLSLFLHGTALELQVDGAWLHSQSTGGVHDSGRLRVQTQLLF